MISITQEVPLKRFQVISSQVHFKHCTFLFLQLSSIWIRYLFASNFHKSCETSTLTISPNSFSMTGVLRNSIPVIFVREWRFCNENKEASYARPLNLFNEEIIKKMSSDLLGKISNVVRVTLPYFQEFWIAYLGFVTKMKQKYEKIRQKMDGKKGD